MPAVWLLEGGHRERNSAFGSLALLVGLVAGTRPGTRPWLPAAAGALLLGSAAVLVLEFETDVPQFETDVP